MINWSDKRRLGLIHLDTLHANTLGTKVINDSSLIGKKINKEQVNQLFYNIDPELGFVGSCQCGAYRGNYYTGHKCSYCGTVVSSEFTNDMTHINWIVLPDNVPPILHPIFYLVFKEWLGKTKSGNSKGKSKIPVIQAILSPNETLPPLLKTHIRKQSFSYFYKHHKEIMDFLFTTYKPTKKNAQTPFVRLMYEENKDKMFVRKIPLLHPSLTPIAKEGKIKAIDPAANIAMSAITNASIMGFESRRCLTESKYIDKMLWKICSDLSLYVEQIITKKFGDKFAHVRRHIMGSRVHYSARSVIVPIVGSHRGDEIHLPWKIVLGGMKNELLNVLMNRKGLTFNEALAKYMKALVIYDDDIYKILMALMKECPYKSFPVLCGRNPKNLGKVLGTRLVII